VSSLGDALLSVAGVRALEVARARGLRVIAKTSITPAVTVYDARDTAPGFLELLGIRTHIVAVDENGLVVAELGEPAPTDPAKAVLMWGALALLGAVVVALAARALR
jgi:hypothetical protein